MPFFSIIMATRNRPGLFENALASVLAQSCSDAEVIVVNDGSSTEHQSQYESILAAADPRRVRCFALEAQRQGHGQSTSFNYGASHATAPYLCFLDDDDAWTDSKHLSRAQKVITDSETSVDLYMTNQAAFLDGVRQRGPIWIEDLAPLLEESNNRPDARGAFDVGVEELLQSKGFCHLNTLIVRRALYEQIGGMEESIRWECDHDLYYRLIDRSNVIKYMPVTVSRHNIPDRRKTESMTTTLSEIERRTYQLAVFERASLNSRNQTVRAHAHRHKGYTQKRLAEALAGAGRHAEAARYAREALRADATFKWTAYTVWRTLRALV